MNATSLYVSASRIVFQTEGNQLNWGDFYRLVPYLRQSLSCSVCGNLLVNPYTPSSIQCQHHVCLMCMGGRKNLKPTCTWCKDYKQYEPNTQLRILLQCYKKLCEHILLTPPYQRMRQQSQTLRNGNNVTTNGGGNNNSPPNSLISFIEEGAQFHDDYKSNSGLTKSEYSILPCLYTTPLSVTASSNQRVANVSTVQSNKMSVSSSGGGGNAGNNVTNHPIIVSKSMNNEQYSVMYTGSGNKLTIKRKTAATPIYATYQTKTQHHVQQSPQQMNQLKQHVQTQLPHSQAPLMQSTPSQIFYSSNPRVVLNTAAIATPNASAIMVSSNQHSIPHQQHRPQYQQVQTHKQFQTVAGFKRPQIMTVVHPVRVQTKRKGCRCGNATPSPGKLTCCGQRCPCYADSKSCVDCKCRGCRNPHTFDGVKMRPNVRTLTKDIDYNDEIIDLETASPDRTTSSSIQTIPTSMPMSLVPPPPQQQHQQQQQQYQLNLQNTTAALTSLRQSDPTPTFMHHLPKQMHFPLQQSGSCQPLDGSNIQVVEVYTCMPQISTTLPSILIEGEKADDHANTITISGSMKLFGGNEPGQYFSTCNSVSEDGNSSDADDESLPGIDI